MRISDWSSDVCSSDLYEVQVRVDVGRDRNDVRLEHQQEVEHHRQHEEVRERAAGVKQRHRRAQQRHREFLLAPVEPRRDERPGLVQQPRRGGERSEEHTSELQSLMRISYAVFCLKKKNTKT